MKLDLSGAIDELVREAPRSWLEALCDEVQSWPVGANVEAFMHRLPPTYNADLSYSLRKVLQLSTGVMSWESLGCALRTCATVYSKLRAEQKVDLLWAGPAPASAMPARRIDQALYDMISAAQKDILLITFAAHKIHRLAEALASASRRDVRIRLLLEFGAYSQNQLSHDALKAFPLDLQCKAEVFYWPLEKRELNVFGKPGKLHAKAAVVDDRAMLSSANLTDDAFLRNFELGALFTGGEMPNKLRQYFDHLVANGTLVRWKPL
jgi:phosphatidylserine/phosphatidylglycerophosphate/cardiolipin synthase-like enzyme